MFQSTHPRGVRPSWLRSRRTPTKFQSTHPRGVRHIDSRASTTSWSFQSTHPRGVRLPGLGHREGHRRVSIHAPARGATRSCTTASALSMFQSTHPRGVRRICNGNDHPPKSFNPRTREGCDLPLPVALVLEAEFQSTHPRGVRLPLRIGCITTRWFQSTHPRGVRRLTVCVKRLDIGFNPRTREGCDFR